MSLCAPDSVPGWLFADSNLVSHPVQGMNVSVMRNIVLVIFHPKTGQQQRQAAVDLVQGVVVGGGRVDDCEGTYYIRVPGDSSGAQALTAAARLRRLPQVVGAILNIVHPVDHLGLSPTMTPGNPPQSAGAQRLWTSAQSGIPYPLRMVIGDSGAFRQLWTKATSSSPSLVPIPDVDFQKHMVVVAGLGTSAASGAVVIDSAKVHGAILDIGVTVWGPIDAVQTRICLEPMIAISPLDMVVVPRQRYSVVRFVEQARSSCPDRSRELNRQDSLVHLLRYGNGGPGALYPLRAVVRDSVSYRHIWNQIVGPSAAPRPAVDFAKYMVVVVAMGVQGSNGSSISLGAADTSGGVLRLWVDVTLTGGGCLAGGLISYPVDVVQVPLSGLNVLFTDRLAQTVCP